MQNSREALPIVGLLALSTTAFLSIVTETMPAGVLPLMTTDLGRSPAEIGMLVGAYAIGAALASIPVVAATRAMPRRMLLIVALTLFCLTNIITAVSSSYAVILAARVLAGVTSGLVWPLVAGYAIRLADGKNLGRAIAIAMSGIAIAMAVGLPLGSYLGDTLGWRASFGLLALLALILIGWVMISLPAVAAMPKENRTAVHRVALLPGLPLVLTMSGIAMFGHYTLYTYIAPLADDLGLAGGTTAALLLFGAGAIIGVVIAGRLVDNHLRRFALTMIALTIVSMTATVASGQIAIFLWGLSFGGMPTVIQAASSRIAATESELATAMVATIYNIGIFAGTAIGGVALSSLGLTSLLWIVVVMMVISFTLVWSGHKFAFLRTN